MDDRYVAKRVIYLLGMSAATILFTTAAAFIRGQYLDEWIVLVIINLVFQALWFFLLEHCRMKRSIAGNRETSYRRIFAGYLASLGVTAVCLVLPEFSRPVMLSAILMLGVGNIELSLCSGLFFCSLLGLFVRWNHPGILHVYPAGSDRSGGSGRSGKQQKAVLV